MNKDNTNNKKTINSDTAPLVVQKKVLRGTVVSDVMNKTVVVKVERFVKHPKYHKFQKMSKKYKAHDELNQYKIGDVIDIISCRPLSKDKHFTVVTTNNA